MKFPRSGMTRRNFQILMKLVVLQVVRKQNLTRQFLKMLLTTKGGQVLSYIGTKTMSGESHLPQNIQQPSKLVLFSQGDEYNFLFLLMWQ